MSGTKSAEFEHLGTITVQIRRRWSPQSGAGSCDGPSHRGLRPPAYRLPEGRLSQMYIKGPYFRGYLHGEVTTVKYTRFERARIIGARALQISMGAPVLLDVSDEMIDPIEISILEFNSGVIPMTVKRGS